MKVNIYRSDTEGQLVLKVSELVDGEGNVLDMTEVLINFLAHIPSIDRESLNVRDENTVGFAINSSVPENEHKDLKVSIVNAVRNLLTQEGEQLKVSYLLTQQQLEAIEGKFVEAQQRMLAATTEVLLYRRYIDRMERITGAAIIVTVLSIVLAIIGILT